MSNSIYSIYYTGYINITALIVRHYRYLHPCIALAALPVNGNKVDEIDMPVTHPATFSLSQPFGVGKDNGTQVSSFYTDAFPFTGTLDKVVFELTD